MQRGPANPSTDPRASSAVGADADRPTERREDLPPVPVGLEHLLALASTSEAFASALREDPLRAANAAGIELANPEQAILGAVSGPALDAMIARVKPALVEPERRLFLERAAAAVAILVGGTALGGCPETKTAEERREPLPKRRPEHPPATAGGARVDRPDGPAPPGGIQPDRPPPPPGPPARPDAGSPRDTTEAPGGSSLRPPAPEPNSDSPRERPSYRQAKGGVRPE